jgi:signal transduction histidine kinase
LKSLQQELDALQVGLSRALTGATRATHESAEKAKSSIEGNDNDAALKFVHQTQMNAERMNTMLKAADLYRGMVQETPERSWVQLEDIVRNEVAEQAPGLLPYLALDSPALCRIYADPAMCKEVVKALVSNAIAYSKDQSRPLVFFRRVLEMDPCVFVLGNTGKGIPQDQVPTLFGLFETGGMDGNEGIGMGLSVARMLTKKHEGKVWMESRVNDGTRVFFHFGAGSQPSEP